MLPSIPLDNVLDGISADPKTGGECNRRSGAGQAPYFLHFFFLQLAHRVILPHLSPSLKPCIPIIIGLFTRPEVERIAARLRAYAIVKNKLPIWNVLTVGNNPRNPMGVEHPETTFFTTNRSGSIPIWPHITSPRPTFVNASDFNLGPKSFLKTDGYKLIENFFRNRLRLHSVKSLIVCHALGYASNARALSL